MLPVVLARLADTWVSVLFSEPKIPQYGFGIFRVRCRIRFSALQRAENSSIRPHAKPEHPVHIVSVLFSEPKIPQCRMATRGMRRKAIQFQCSSASRKFLNAGNGRVRLCDSNPFQCSSASRKFLNLSPLASRSAPACCFSALQRAENSSMVSAGRSARGACSFQCSSASRKFLNLRTARRPRDADRCGFSALQRAENSSIV